MRVRARSMVSRKRAGLKRDVRGAAALEFAIIAIPFLALMLFVFEISLDLFTQAVVDSALQVAARQVQTGNAQNVKDGNDFISRYLCPDMGGLLSCDGLNVKVERLSPNSTQDFYDFTTGSPPVVNGSLDLSSYAAGKFCNGGPSQLLLVSVVYVGPTLVGALLPTGLSVDYNGQLVHPTLSTVGIVSEGYAAGASPKGTAASC